MIANKFLYLITLGVVVGIGPLALRRKFKPTCHLSWQALRPSRSSA